MPGVFIGIAFSGELYYNLLLLICNCYSPCAMSLQNLSSLSSFPRGNYTPHGYLDNPAHSGVMNRSGVIRSVPPVGFGFWCRPLPCGYTSGLLRQINYLSFLHPSITIDDLFLHTEEDFAAENIALSSSYHSSRVFTYDFTARDVACTVEYTLPHEHALLCHITFTNTGKEARNITLNATNIYGHVALRSWGSDGFYTHPHPEGNALFAGMWACGDVYMLDADTPPDGLCAHTDRDAWRNALKTGEDCDALAVHCTSADAVYATRCHRSTLAPGASYARTLCLARGVNQEETTATARETLAQATHHRKEKYKEDDVFYAQMPHLIGDWPDTWKEGWIHDFETLRMNVRPPCGIFTGRWDAMQVFTPRLVLGESALDMMAFSYADPTCAQEVMRTAFVDTPGVHVPCCREDGSMNMVGSDGSECGTSPVWGLPFKVIMSLYRRAPDDAWLAEMYTHMARFVEWWRDNRTDDEGWFFCRNSWESGQDGSRRFCVDDVHEGDPADFVRTVDVEATMAHAQHTLAEIATVLGDTDAAAMWQERADINGARARSMFHEGWFRDVDGRTDTPIILEDYFDVMMLVPVALGIASKEQTEACAQHFSFFRDNPSLWLEWPSFMMFFADAVWHAGQTTFIADIIAQTATRVYNRITARTTIPAEKSASALPSPYHYRIPGVAWEYWPLELKEGKAYGAENYGWGATLPLHFITVFFGFRVDVAPDQAACTLAPTLPTALRIPGKTYGITGLRFRAMTCDITLTCRENDMLDVSFAWRASAPCTLRVDAPHDTHVTADTQAHSGTLCFTCAHGAITTLTLDT